MLEVLFVCEQNDNNISCTAWDFRTGTNLMTYKGGGCAQMQSLNVLRAEYIFAANNAKPLLHVWPINNQEQLKTVRFVVPGTVQALALSKCGNYLVAGIQETIYIWHLATGKMINTLAKHYQPITCIRFTDDSSHFVTCSKDGGVLVWNFTQSVGQGENRQTPYYMFNDHGLPVTDVHVGLGALRSYIYTVSLDRTCKIYDLNSGKLLLSVVFNEGLQCITVNKLETCVYVGSVNGNIYEFHIDSVPRTKEYHMDEEHTNCFRAHGTNTPVNCLALSCDGQTLISGGQDKQICVWHIPSRQLLKSQVHKGPITNILLRTTMLTVFQPEHKQPHVFGGNLRRMIENADGDENITISVLVKEPIIDTKVVNELGVDVSLSKLHSNFMHTPNRESAKTEKELEELREEVLKLKATNKRIFEFACKKIVEAKD